MEYKSIVDGWFRDNSEVSKSIARGMVFTELMGVRDEIKAKRREELRFKELVKEAIKEMNNDRP